MRSLLLLVPFAACAPARPSSGDEAREAEAAARRAQLYAIGMERMMRGRQVPHEPGPDAEPAPSRVWPAERPRGGHRVVCECFDGWSCVDGLQDALLVRRVDRWPKIGWIAIDGATRCPVTLALEGNVLPFFAALPLDRAKTASERQSEPAVCCYDGVAHCSLRGVVQAR